MSTGEVIARCEIKGVLQELPEVEKLIDDVCQEVSITEEKYGNILIAVTEAVTNGILHGSSEEDNVQVLAVNDAGTLSFTVKDCGPGFDFDNLPDPTAPENIEMENGRGVYLMRSLADQIEFANNGSEVTLKFKKS